MRDRFQTALAALFLEEGVYSNDPDDPGGETFRGVSRRHHPDWPGWALVDAAKASGPGWEFDLDRDPRMRGLLEDFYRERFWGPSRAEALPFPIGERVFDLDVNTGRGAEILQAVLRGLNENVSIDGAIGPQTLEAVGRVDSRLLFDALQGGHACYYVGLIAARPEKRRFRRGWLERAFSEHPAQVGAT